MTTDVYTPEQRSAVMRRVRGRDTGPELKVRRILRAAGFGYRLGGQDLPGRPDVVMHGRRLALFVHGCFWHGHDCARGARMPKANAEYWSAKIARNRARDARVVSELQDGGWRVMTVWECELRDPHIAEVLVERVRSGTASGRPQAASESSADPASAPLRTCSSAVNSAAGVRGLETK